MDLQDENWFVVYVCVFVCVGGHHCVCFSIMRLCVTYEGLQEEGSSILCLFVQVLFLMLLVINHITIEL